MRLRIVGGTLKRRTIEVRKGQSDFRPTLERIRQAIAESLKNRVGGAKVADLCAGCGAFGFEMLSRGAGQVHFVEVDRGRAAVIREHTNRFGVAARCKVFALDIGRFLRTTHETYDIIYFDPPYDDADIAGLLRKVLGHLAEDGVCLYEHRKGDGFERLADEMPGVETSGRVYGRTRVDYIRRVVSPPPVEENP